MTSPNTGTGGVNELEVDLLEGVALDFFTATPAGIGPFGASLLKWKVTGAVPGVRVFVDERRVSPASSLVVQPTQSTTYHLAVSAGGVRKELAAVAIAVDLSSCGETEFNPFPNARAALIAFVDNTADIYWPPRTADGAADNPTLTVGGGKIAFRMLLQLDINNAPDLWVTLHGSFSLDVVDGRFVARDATWSGSAEWPRWFWFVSGIIGGLALAINDAKQKATDSARQVIDALVDLFNALALPSEGKRMRAVRIEEAPPRIVYTECASGELDVFAGALDRARPPD